MKIVTNTLKEIRVKILQGHEALKTSHKIMGFVFWFSSMLSAVSTEILITGGTFFSANPWWAFSISITVAIFSFFYKKYTLPELALGAVMFAEEAEKKHKEELTSINLEVEQVKTRRKLSVVEAIAMKVAIGKHLSSNEIDIDVLVKLIFRMVDKTKEVLFGISDDEMWNFVLYIYNKQTERLEPFSRDLSQNHTSYANVINDKMGRSWKPEEGHVGKTFSSRETILISDYSEQSANYLKKSIPDIKKRETDSSTYVSFIAVPLVSPEKAEPTGVFVGTTNIKNRFTEKNKVVIEDIARALSTVYALYEHDNEIMQNMDGSMNLT